MKRDRLLVVLEICCPVAFVAFVWVWTDRAGSPFFPPLSTVVHSFASTWLGSGFFSDAVPSLARWLIGFSVAGVVGVIAGVWLGRSVTAYQVCRPVIEFFRAMPPPALVPVVIVLLGIGNTMKVFLIAFVCVFPILLNAQAGVSELDRSLLDTAEVYRIPKRAIWWRILLPGSLPRIMVGLRISLTLGLVVIVLSEMVASTNGLGFYILSSLREFSIVHMWSGVLFIALLGYVANVAFLAIEKRVLRWRGSGS